LTDGTQFAWLGTALHSSPYKQGVACCTPVIPSGGVSGHRFPPYKVHFTINFKIEKPELERKATTGQYWHSMFRNPIIVKGYPIPNKPAPYIGLEILLDMMAGLVQAGGVSDYNGKPFLQGFSSMLIPTKRNEKDGNCSYGTLCIVMMEVGFRIMKVVTVTQKALLFLIFWEQDMLLDGVLVLRWMRVWMIERLK
jgi:hypothetical protein